MIIRVVDKLALAGIALGFFLVLQRWWAGGFHVGFYVTAGFTVLHIVTNHLIRPEET
jgi:hypothetical protein